MIRLAILCPTFILAIALPLIATEAPPDMKQFNIVCPAPQVLPVLDRVYHECNNGFANGSCEDFVRTFWRVLLEYDCQRPFDAIGSTNFVVPAVWLAGDAALEDYVHLLSRLSSGKDKSFTSSRFRQAAIEARKLFGSKQFQKILDGHLAEEYLPLSKRVEAELKRKGTR